MSTATAFVSIGSFPVCVPSGSPADGVAVSNLTLAEVMAFFWNLETFSLTVTGSVTTGGTTSTFDDTITLAPIASSVLFNRAALEGGYWFGSNTGSSPVAFGSVPSALRQPKERVCAPSDNYTWSSLTTLYLLLSNSVTSHTGTLAFAIANDPVNAGKYILYAIVDIRGNASGGNMIWANQAIGLGGYTAITNGTIVLGGITLPWYSAYHATSYTGGTLAASSTSFTY